MSATDKYQRSQEDLIEQLMPPNQVVEMFPNLYSENELKSLIKNRRYNGLDRAVIKIPGRKLMISLPDFKAWIRSRMDYK